MADTYVLIHGAWHDGSGWADVAGHIRAEGHTVHTPTLAGNGHGDGIDRTIGHETATASAVAYIEGEGLDDIVLVGHSYGGTIISAVAEAIGERIRRLVYWNAFVLLDGESIDDVSPPHYKDMMDGSAAQRGDGSCVLPFVVWREVFCNDMDLAEAQRTYELTSPHPRKTLSDKLSLEAVLGPADREVLHQLHRGHRHAPRRLRLASALQRPAGPVPHRADARRP